MSACITPNHQHTSTKINESTLLFKRFFKRLKTEKPSTKSYVSTWKFLDSHEFLKDSLVARPIKSNLMTHHLAIHQFIIAIIRLLLSLSGRW